MVGKFPIYFYFRIKSGLKEVKIEDASDVDVVEVVRCVDCKYNKGVKKWNFDDCTDTTADCCAGHGYPPLDWFCADGEKREES